MTSQNLKSKLIKILRQGKSDEHSFVGKQTNPVELGARFMN